MILYCDTSALIKRYVDEEGSARVNDLWDGSSAIATSVVAFAETLAALNRKRRENILVGKDYTRTAAQFKNDFSHCILVPVTSALNAAIETLVRAYPLRGFDAIHLASALVIRNADKSQMLFACFDRTLNSAAASEGLRIGIS